MRAMSAMRSCACAYESSSFSGYACTNGLPPCARAVCSNAVKTVVTGQDGKMPRAIQTTGAGNESKVFHRGGTGFLHARACSRHDQRDARIPGVPDLLPQLPRVREEGERCRQG